MNKNKGQYPFHYIKFPVKTNEKGTETFTYEEPFIEQVKMSLKSDIQRNDSFGCMINDCHSHAGSKMHFENFIEAELLFHNNYYNEHFAQLTFKYIRNILEKNTNEYKNVLIIGYENYSELYLQELKKIIIQENDKNSIKITKCEYCVYEVNSVPVNSTRINEVRIRNLNKSHDNKNIFIAYGDKEFIFSVKDTLCVFIVPINTSLSTMDKMVDKFCSVAGIDDINLHREHICLITLGPKSNSVMKSDAYWKREDDFLVPQKDKFEYISSNIKIYNLVMFETDWNFSNKCKKCYPDKIGEKKESLEDEMPIFGVNRGSVVPMLKIGTKKYLNPINTEDKYTELGIGNNKSIVNLKRVWDLSDFMFYEHVIRGENHFQYYLETGSFLQKYARIIKETFLTKLKDKVSQDFTQKRS